MPLNQLIPLMGKGVESRKQLYLQNQLLQATMGDKVKAAGLAVDTAEQNLQIGEQNLQRNDQLIEMGGYKLSEAEVNDTFDVASKVQAMWGTRDPASIEVARSNPLGEQLANDLQAYFANPTQQRAAVIDQSFENINKARQEFSSTRKISGNDEVHASKWFVNDQGQMVVGLSNGDTQVTSENAAVDYHLEKVTSQGADGDIEEQWVAYPKRNLQNGSTVIDRNAGVPVEVHGNNARLNYDAQAPQVGSPQGIPLDTGVQTTEGAAAMAGAITGAEEFQKAEGKFLTGRAEIVSDRMNNAMTYLGKATTMQQEYDVMNLNIDRALENTDYSTAGLGGWFMGKLSGTDAQALRTSMNTILSKTAFDRLGRMREESPTGGALGQVSNFEIELLKAAKGALDQATSPEEVRRALNQIRVAFMADAQINDLKKDYYREVMQKDRAGHFDGMSVNEKFKELEGMELALWDKVEAKRTYWTEQQRIVNNGQEPFQKMEDYPDQVERLKADPTEANKKDFFNAFGELPELGAST